MFSWKKEEIVVINGVEYLNKEASKRFFDTYKEQLEKAGLQNNTMYIKVAAAQKLIEYLRKNDYMSTLSSEQRESFKKLSSFEQEVLINFHKNINHIHDEFDLSNYLLSTLKLSGKKSMSPKDFEDVYNLLKTYNQNGKYNFTSKDLYTFSIIRDLKTIVLSNTDEIVKIGDIIKSCSSIEQLDIVLKALALNQKINASNELCEIILTKIESFTDGKQEVLEKLKNNSKAYYMQSQIVGRLKLENADGMSTIAKNICIIAQNEVNNEIEFFKLLLDRKRYCDKQLNIYEIIKYAQEVSDKLNIKFDSNDFLKYSYYYTTSIEEVMKKITTLARVLDLLEFNKKYEVYSDSLVYSVINKICEMDEPVDEIVKKLMEKSDKYYKVREIIKGVYRLKKIDSTISSLESPKKEIYEAIKNNNPLDVYIKLGNLSIDEFANLYFECLEEIDSKKATESEINDFKNEITKMLNKNGCEKLYELLSANKSEDIYSILLDTQKYSSTPISYETVKKYIEEIKRTKGTDLFSSVEEDKLSLLFLIKESKSLEELLLTSKDKMLTILEYNKQYKIKNELFSILKIYESLTSEERKKFIFEIIDGSDKYYNSLNIIDGFKFYVTIDLQLKTADALEKNIYLIIKKNSTFDSNVQDLEQILCNYYNTLNGVSSDEFAEKVNKCLKSVSYKANYSKEEYVRMLEGKYKVTRRRKATTTKDKGKVKFAIVLGTCTVSLAVMAIAGLNPVSAITACIKSLAGYAANEVGAFSLIGKLVGTSTYFAGLTAYFTGVLAGFSDLVDYIKDKMKNNKSNNRRVK